MTVIRPFRALRPRPEFAGAVAAPPYDVLSREEAKALAAGNPLSFLHVEKSEIDLDPYPPADEGEIYRLARENLLGLVRDGVLVRDERECFYIYRETMGGHAQYGIVCTVAVKAYEEGIVKIHELTRADKERERTLHVEAVNAHTGPVFIAYRRRGDLDAAVARLTAKTPQYDFTADDGVAHTVWVVDDEQEKADLQALLGRVGDLYIADGHHRAAAAVAAARKRRGAGAPAPEGGEFFLAVLFPHDQLRILAYNRVVRDLHGLTVEGFLRRVGEGFLVSPDAEAHTPRRPHEFGLYVGGRWYRLLASAGGDPDDPVQSLDVTILQERLLRPILGIGDPRTDERIDFVGGIRGFRELERLVDAGGFAAAFSLFPTSLEELMAVADAGRIMPPKSTWFEPKLRSGLFVHLLD
ncbi:MAG TPA: DUF1015 family protein [Syntrophales bacterium]|nr:DUF1015 family protein [Syntrophales bacterium]HOM08009.1 DUF1015 family protein [Syntrophales bacterium]HOO00635.1 DUF1015 family protein [Syntrophales bacterium]HPC01889.1 DUF1015 family protein [Syntrophales bacterium]HPQ05841.1 DUF1015 family protein [Syntrophales bacterium]